VLREWGDEREKLEENHTVLVVRPTRGRLWWLEPVSSIPTADARRGLTSEEGKDGVAAM
jgi:hypothetical protein